MRTNSTYSMGAMRHCSKVSSTKTRTHASSRWLNSALVAMTTKHLVSPSGLLELHAPFGLLRFLGISMARYVHPSLASWIRLEAIGHSVVLAGDTDNTQVELHKCFLPSGRPCGWIREVIHMLFVPVLK